MEKSKCSNYAAGIDYRGTSRYDFRQLSAISILEAMDEAKTMMDEEKAMGEDLNLVSLFAKHGQGTPETVDYLRILVNRGTGWNTTKYEVTEKLQFWFQDEDEMDNSNTQLFMLI